MMTRREKNILKCLDEIDDIAYRCMIYMPTVEMIQKETHSIRRKIWRGKKKDMLTTEEKGKIFKLMALKETQRRNILNIDRKAFNNTVRFYNLDKKGKTK